MHKSPRMLTRFVAACIAVGLQPLEVNAAGAAWEPFIDFPATASGRTEALAIYHRGTLYALGGQPYRCPGGDVCADPESGAADYLPAGAVEWLQSQPFDDRLGRLGGGVDALDRPVAFGGAQGDATQGTDKTFIYDLILGDQTEPNLARRNYRLTNFAWTTDDRGRLYSIGGGPGVDADIGNPNSADVERYDPRTDTWSLLAQMPEARANAAAVFDGQGRVLVFGGYDTYASNRANRVLAYDVASDTWSMLSEVPPPTEGDNGFTDQRAVMGDNGRVYLVGGINGPVSAGITRNQVYTYEPVTATWGSAPLLGTPRHATALTRGADGWIYALGGRNGAAGLSSTERLDTSPTGTECTTASDCSDGLSCNGDEFCVDGTCVDGIDVQCGPDEICSAGGICRVHRYDLVDLGALITGSGSAANAIDNTGRVVGEFFDTVDGRSHGFLYDGAMLDLGPGRALAISDDGWIAGEDGTALMIHPITGIRADLGTLGGGASAAFGVSTGGWSVGRSGVGAGADRAFLVRGPGAVMEDLGTLGGYSIAHGVNRGGLVVGESLVTSYDAHAEPFVFDASVVGSVMRVLSGPYAAGSARAVTDTGLITGWVSNNVDNWGRAFIHDGVTLENLGSVPGKAYSIGTALNRKGQVVGFAFGEWVHTACCGSLWSNNVKRAYFHDGVVAVDLNDELPESSGWLLTQAAGINDSGAIVGAGIFAGKGRAFLLRPHSPNGQPGRGARRLRILLYLRTIESALRP